MSRIGRGTASCIIVLVTLLLSGCSKNLTGPTFGYTGTWTGSFVDQTVLLPGYVAFKGTFTLVVEEDGTATGEGFAEYAPGGGVLRTHVRIEGEVLADGAVRGTSHYTQTITGGSPLNMSGLVVGQLDESGGRGTGVLDLGFFGTRFYIDWTVSR